MKDKPKLNKNLPAKTSFLGNLKYGGQMWRDYRKKQYPKFPWKSLLAITTAFLYVVFPVDIIPEYIVGFGLIDDAVITALAIKAIDMDIADYKKWMAENENKNSEE